MPVFPIVGPPGAQAPVRVTFRRIFEGSGSYLSLPGGVYIDGVASRDPNNSPTTILEPGLLMGFESASPYSLATTILGVTQGAYTSGGLSLTVTPAQAAEIARRVGSPSGSLLCVGPPTAGGTLAITAVSYSAINTSTGVLTVSSLGVNKIAGSFLTATDGSGVPSTFIPEGSGIVVVDNQGNSVSLVQLPIVPVAGVIASPNSGPNAGLINWPSDTSLQTWIITSLSSFAGGKFIFMNQYGNH